MPTLFEDQHQFMMRVGQEPISLYDVLTLGSEQLPSLTKVYKTCIEEELEEIKEALYDFSELEDPHLPSNRDVRVNQIAALADGALDLIYVAIGFLHSLGLPPHVIKFMWNDIHSANLAKLDGPKRADGKQLKPEGWKPPNHAETIRTYLGAIEDMLGAGDDK